jgi:prephenate dehydratase
MSDCKLNLTKIQSPKMKHHGNILFVDVTFEKYEDYAKAKSLLILWPNTLKSWVSIRIQKYKDPQVTIQI